MNPRRKHHIPAPRLPRIHMDTWPVTIGRKSLVGATIFSAIGLVVYMLAERRSKLATSPNFVVETGTSPFSADLVAKLKAELAGYPLAALVLVPPEDPSEDGDYHPLVPDTRKHRLAIYWTGEMNAGEFADFKTAVLVALAKVLVAEAVEHPRQPAKELWD